MGKIKVLELIDGGFLGGGQTNVLSIAKNLNPEKYSVSIAAQGGGKFEKAANENMVKFYSMDLPKVLRRKYLRKLENLFDIKRYDIIHSHGGTAGFYGRLMKKHHPEIKVVHTIHGIHYLNKDGFFVKKISRTIEQYLVQFTDMTICETKNDLKAALENRIAGKYKSVVINNGINACTYQGQLKNKVLLSEFGLTENNFIIGNISRFDVQKNQKLIIQAAYYLSKNYPEMKFVLVGDGKCFKQMKEYAEEANLQDVIIFAGERENLRDFYSIFDVFVFPSLWEGMPYVLLEAMASGLPIICSNIPNHCEIVKDNHSAFLIDPYDMDDLFHKVNVLYQHKEIRNKLGENAQNDVKQFDEKLMVKRIETIYNEVLIN